MTVPGALSDNIPSRDDAWSWWETRRLRYNLALAAAGWAAYGLSLALFYGFHHPVWQNWRGGLGMTLFLGLGFLVLMGIANIFYLLGATVEKTVSPMGRDAYRRRAWAMGFWGSVALPFLFPLANFCMLLGQG